MKTLATALALAAVTALPALAGNQKKDTPFHAVTGAFLAVSVPDMAASVAWYSDKLGLSVVMEIPRQGGTAVTVLEGNGLIVELIQHDRALPLRQAAPSTPDEQFIHGIFKAGLIVQDFDRTVEELRLRGADIAFGPYPATDTQRANVIIRDNAGNLIQFFGR